MDEELLELQRQFEFAQQAKSSVRLSERNVVELVQKLQQLGIIDFDLLHTTSGKEYITPEQLRKEIGEEIKKLGRVSVIDLADITGVDLYHVEKQAEHLVSNDPNLMLVNGEIITNSYWDGVAEEINERLQECSQIVLAEIAAQLQVGSELVLSILEPRVGTLIKGRLEGGQLYTPAYVARVNAMVRGAARGVFVPLNLPALWNSLQGLLAETDGASGVAVEGSFFQSLFNGLVKEGEILGSLRAGVHWTPTVFAVAQKECVDSFFSQNSYIDYGAVQKLGIPQPVQYLQSRYSEGIALDTLFAHPSIVEMLDSSAEDAFERGSWVDALSVLPSSFSSQDASKVLSLCPSVQNALKSNKAIILGDSYVFSNGFLQVLFDRLENDTETLNLDPSASLGLSDSSQTNNDASSNDALSGSNETGKLGLSGKQAPDKGSKKKKGKSMGNSKMEAAEVDLDYQETAPTKSKKNQKKSKVASSSHASDSRPGAKKDNDKTKEDSLNCISEEWLIQKIKPMVPDIEEQGIEDPEAFLAPLASYLRPKLLNSLKERRKAAFTQNAQRMKRVMDNLQRKLDESFLNMQLYEKALDLFEDDPSTSVLLHKHLLRSTATPIVDFLLLDLDTHNKLKNGIEAEDSEKTESTLSPGDRNTLAKSLPGPLSQKALAVIESLEAKRVETFMTALRALVDESGLVLKKLDKKLERTLLHSYRKDLLSQISAESDPVSILPKVVSLLYVQIHGKALQAPGRAISIAVTRLKDKLDDEAFKILQDYQAATVSLLALMAGATGDAEDCTSDRILTKKELLEELMPALKGLVLGSSQP
ncbi:OLC1v1004161C1 [Oldenlandia corymbosa var. corymbosa]|uniref:OLC1v1004161C1 n=1 Tax=Oldenlandia corymbosa var. corymbosa TaxID=529605 RepID=A0AAV1DCV4_OLDCO|nr:OLC1v1004161C1 [Oldenlandia corymbosa var. corymbosa]